MRGYIELQRETKAQSEQLLQLGGYLTEPRTKEVAELIATLGMLEAVLDDVEKLLNGETLPVQLHVFEV